MYKIVLIRHLLLFVSSLKILMAKNTWTCSNNVNARNFVLFPKRCLDKQVVFYRPLQNWIAFFKCFPIFVSSTPVVWQTIISDSLLSNHVCQIRSIKRNKLIPIKFVCTFVYILNIPWESSHISIVYNAIEFCLPKMSIDFCNLLNKFLSWRRFTRNNYVN